MSYGTFRNAAEVKIMGSRHARNEGRDVAVQTDHDESLCNNDLLSQNHRGDPEDLISSDGEISGFRKFVDNVGKSGEKALGFVKSQKAFQQLQGRLLKLDITAKGQVNLYKLRTPKGRAPIVRLDVPHGNVGFNHVNINPKLAGLARDPHLKLPPGALPVGRGLARTAKAINQANKVLLPLAVAVDVARTGYAVSKNVKNKTSRNTVETTASIAGGWAGGFGGAAAGAAAGTVILPGIGTIVGGLIGAVSGGIGGAVGSTALVNHIGDACDYDMIRKRCAHCRCLFYIRMYAGEKKDWDCCAECRHRTADKGTQCPEPGDYDSDDDGDDYDYDIVDPTGSKEQLEDRLSKEEMQQRRGHPFEEQRPADRPTNCVKIDGFDFGGFRVSSASVQALSEQGFETVEQLRSLREPDLREYVKRGADFVTIRNFLFPEKPCEEKFTEKRSTDKDPPPPYQPN